MRKGKRALAAVPFKEIGMGGLAGKGEGIRSRDTQIGEEPRHCRAGLG